MIHDVKGYEHDDATRARLRQLADVALYLREFDRLRAGARYGGDAEALLDRIAADLRAES